MIKNPFTIAISFAILEQPLESFSAKLDEHFTLCINPAFTKIIEGTEKSRIPSKFAKRIARYKEFRYKITTMEFLVSFFFFVGDSNSSI